MKIISILILLLCSGIVIAQEPFFGGYKINFENEVVTGELIIDTINYPENIWEIGHPNKTIFDSAFSTPNAICTDLDGSYPVNDTSVFTIKNIAGEGFEKSHTAVLYAKYKIDSDTLADYGKIEFSPDNGNTWVDLLNDTLYFEMGYYWWSEKPTFTGKSNGWREFAVWLAGFGSLFDIGNWNNSDTVIYRFTFISDSLQTNKDGWILDDIQFEDWSESIDNKGLDSFESIVYPNPAIYSATIEFPNKEGECYEISIYNSVGRRVLRFSTESDKVIINVNDFQQGIYFYRIQNKDLMSIGKILKE